MGQCAPSSLNYSPGLGDDDKFSVVSFPADLFDNSKNNYARNDAPCKESNFKSYTKQREDFLRPHRPDKSQLVDESKIKNMSWQQSDELLRQQGLLKMHGASFKVQHNQVMRAHEDQSSKNHLFRLLSMSVLRFKVKAHLGRFCMQHYMNMFPNELNIAGSVPRKEDAIPMLTSESSTSSFSSSSSSNSGYPYSVDRSMPPLTPVRCSLTNKSFLDLAVTGCLGLVPRGQHFEALRPSRRHVRERNEKTSDNCVVLINKSSGSPLAVCALEPESETLVRMYSTRRMIFAQTATTTTHELGLDWTDNLSLYPWAEVKLEGESPGNLKFSVFMAKRYGHCSSIEPSYIAFFDWCDSNDTSAVRVPIIKVVGRTENESEMSGCAQISIQSDEIVTKHSDNISDLSFHINLSQGIDPAFLICLTAIMDEAVEKSMRTRCRNQTRGLVRKDSFSLAKKRLESNCKWDCTTMFTHKQ